MSFVPVEIDAYIDLHLKNNPDLSPHEDRGREL